MAVTIDRTNYNLLVDDDTTNTVGTIWTKTQVKNVIMDPIDVALAALMNDALTNYTATSTISGWSSFTSANKGIFYKQFGKMVFVVFHIEGTSNSVNTSFTVPFTAATLVTNSSFGGLLTYTKDNGTASATPGLAFLSPGTSTVSIYKDSIYTGWTNSGAKWIEGSFWYQTT